MTPEKLQLPELMLAKAWETFDEVSILVENSLWNTAVNRVYYACFYAVSALLVSNDLNAKTHSGAQQMFGLHFLKTGLIREETGDFFSLLFRMRQKADYEYLVEYERDDVLSIMQPAKDLIAEIEQYLAK